MIINSVTSTPNDYLVVKVETNNLAAINAQIAQDNQTTTATGLDLDGSASDVVDMQTMRSALDRRIDQDVASDIISASEALMVRKMLDEIDAQANRTRQAQATSRQSNNTDEVRTSNSSTKANNEAEVRTVLTETVTINGPLKTTVTVYSDGTRETATIMASPGDVQKYDQQTYDENAANATAMRYLSTIEAGTLFTQMA